MEKESVKKIKNPQEVQDEIFRRMSADKKIKLGSQLWYLAKTLVSNEKSWRKRTQGSF